MLSLSTSTPYNDIIYPIIVADTTDESIDPLAIGCE